MKIYHITFQVCGEIAIFIIALEMYLLKFVKGIIDLCVSVQSLFTTRVIQELLKNCGEHTCKLLVHLNSPLTTECVEIILARLLFALFHARNTAQEHVTSRCDQMDQRLENLHRSVREVFFEHRANRLPTVMFKKHLLICSFCAVIYWHIRYAWVKVLLQLVSIFSQGYDNKQLYDMISACTEHS